TWNGALLVPDGPGQNSQYPSFCNSGQKIVFSRFDLGSRNVWSVQSDGTALARITTHAATLNGDERPAMSDSGLLLVFESNANPLGTNPDGNREVFTCHSDGSNLTQITNTTAGSAYACSITSDGSKIAFHFFGANLLGGNPDLGTELYVCNFDGSGMVQISFTGTGGANGIICGDGSTVIWSDAGFGMNTVWKTNPNGTGTTPLVTLQNAYTLPKHCTNQQGTVAVFRSDADPFGTNIDMNNEIFVVDTTTGTYWQVTQTVDSGPLGNANMRPFLARGGGLIVFMTQSDLTGNNPDYQSELFTILLAGVNLRQITQSSQAIPVNADWQNVSVDFAGAAVAVVTAHDFTGGPAGQARLWRLTPPPVVPFRRGDANDDHLFDIADPVTILSALFGGGTLTCDQAGDANDDGALDIADAVFALSALFVAGSPLPPPPHPNCGPDPTPGGTLGCNAFLSCP
ncbi:MAG: hypothetical protein KC729_12645, partial [Candidatus Eisenbacteria bacterium]|nr:hypothetical protein [Candidatus Eisenbacteria bacterium]